MNDNNNEFSVYKSDDILKKDWVMTLFVTGKQGNARYVNRKGQVFFSFFSLFSFAFAY